MPTRPSRALLGKGVDFLKVQAGLSPEAYHAIMKSAAARHATVVGTRAGVDRRTRRRPIGPAQHRARFARAGRRRAAALRVLEPRDRTAGGAARDRTRSGRGYTAGHPRTRGRASARSSSTRSIPAQAHVSWAARSRRPTSPIVPTLVWSNSLPPARATDDGHEVPLEFVPGADAQALAGGARAVSQSGRAGGLCAERERRETVAARAVGALHAAGARVLGRDGYVRLLRPARLQLAR